LGLNDDRGKGMEYGGCTIKTGNFTSKMEIYWRVSENGIFDPPSVEFLMGIYNDAFNHYFFCFFSRMFQPIPSRAPKRS
jgi:hypothetical protein